MSFAFTTKETPEKQILPKYLINKIIGVQRIDAGITSAINRTAQNAATACHACSCLPSLHHTRRAPLPSFKQPRADRAQVCALKQKRVTRVMLATSAIAKRNPSPGRTFISSDAASSALMPPKSINAFLLVLDDVGAAVADAHAPLADAEDAAGVDGTGMAAVSSDALEPVSRASFLEPFPTVPVLPMGGSDSMSISSCSSKLFIRPTFRVSASDVASRWLEAAVVVARTSFLFLASPASSIISMHSGLNMGLASSYSLTSSGSAAENFAAVVAPRLDENEDPSRLPTADHTHKLLSQLVVM
jgi:hypothetical protein